MKALEDVECGDREVVGHAPERGDYKNVWDESIVVKTIAPEFAAATICKDRPRATACVFYVDCTGLEPVTPTLSK